MVLHTDRGSVLLKMTYRTVGTTGESNPFVIIGKPDSKRGLAEGIDVTKVSLDFDNGGPVVLIELEDTSSTEAPAHSLRESTALKDQLEKETKMQSNVSIPSEVSAPIEKGYQYGIKTPDGNVIWQRNVSNEEVYIEGVGFVAVGLVLANPGQKSLATADEAWRDKLQKAGVPLTEDMHLVRVRRLVTLLVEQPEEF